MHYIKYQYNCKLVKYMHALTAEGIGRELTLLICKVCRYLQQLEYLQII